MLRLLVEVKSNSLKESFGLSFSPGAYIVGSAGLLSAEMILSVDLPLKHGLS